MDKSRLDRIIEELQRKATDAMNRGDISKSREINEEISRLMEQRKSL